MRLNTRIDLKEESQLEEHVVRMVMAELHFSTNKYGAFNSSHEAMGVLREEFDEAWDACKNNDLQGMQSEAVQVAAMAIRLILDSMKTIGAK